MKKVLVVVAAPLTNDGLTKIALDVFRYNKGKYEFAFATPGGTDQVILELLGEQGAQYYQLPDKRDLTAYMHTLRVIVRRSVFDLVYVHGNSAFMIVEALAARRGGAKVVSHCHDTSSNHKAMHHLLKPFFFLFFDAKIGCSTAASRWAYNGKNVDTVPNGIDAEQYRYDSVQRERVRRELDIEDQLVIGFVGRLADQKNPLFLLDVFCELLKIQENAALLIVGQGDLEDAIHAKIAELGLERCVRMTGATSDVSQYYQAMDIVLLPSKYEGFGLVAVEAQAAGLPVLMSDVFVDDVCVTGHIDRLSLASGPKAWAETALKLTEGIDRAEELTGVLEMTTEKMNEKIAAVIDRVMGS